MELRRYTHADAVAVRPMLLDIHDEVYSDYPDPFHSRDRFSYFVDLWSGREDWRCVAGWEGETPVRYAYGSKFKPGGWWKGAVRPAGVSGRIFALSELMVRSRWSGTGRARQIHDALLDSAGSGLTEELDFVTLLVDATRPKVRALYEAWGYEPGGECASSDGSPTYTVVVRPLRSS
ncbi:GNAT family N-acetyltransferase [Streptomyces albidoflavus]